MAALITNALSVDVEEYYHAAIFRRGTGGARNDAYESRVVAAVDRLLDLLSRHDARGTFFVLGEVAASHPAMVRGIAARGHEVACHSDTHEDVYRHDPDEFRADTRRAKSSIEDALGDRIVGYRAPNFSIGRAQTWAYQILLEEGFTYDSSMFPIFHDRYGQTDAPRFPYEIWRDGDARLIEFPIGTVRLHGVNLPIGGGGYFRFAPYWLMRKGIERVNALERLPVMFYMHPWEMDPGQPRPAMTWRHRVRHYTGVRTHQRKLERLLTHFRFESVQHLLSAVPA